MSTEQFIASRERVALGVTTLLEAQALHRRGELARAETLYREILRHDARHAKALHLLGVLALQSKQPAAAVDLIRRSIHENDRDASAHFDLACALVDAAQAPDALAAFARAVELRPGFIQAWNGLGTALLTLGEAGEALACFEHALAADAGNVVALHNRGNALMELHRAAEALECYDRALRIKGNHAELHNGRGSALKDLGRADEALAAFAHALTNEPRHVGALLNRGILLLELGSAAEALESFERALALDGRNADALNRRGLALLVAKRVEDALASFEAALRSRRDFVEAHTNRGGALLKLNRPAEALASFEHALQHKPGHASALAFASLALLDLGRPDEALASCDRALALEPDDAFALNNRAGVLWRLKRHEDAAETLARLVAVQPDCDYALGFSLFARLYCCHWDGYDGDVQRLRAAVRDGARACRPFSFMPVCDNAAEQRLCAELIVADHCPPAAEPLCNATPYAHERIRVAYLSADFHNHATAFLAAELFERHDRSRFEITAVSFGPPREDAMRARLCNAFEHFLDVRELPDRAIAELLREREIDIAIDLKGHTKDARPQIFARRPAPLQVSFLGYPGTSGAPYIDYLVADEEVIPDAAQAHYSERILYLPHCYQPNDSTRSIAAETPTRAKLGLPEQGFVFCCFNNGYKITPDVFAVWMRLLRSVDGSVLWLLQGNAAAQRNLQAAAQRQGVDPERLVFAARAPLPEHLARQRRADLFLDTLPVNAHTTASDALWAGLPVLSCRGESFVARVAASLLKTIGLPELVTDSLDAYAKRALHLARHPEELTALRARLGRNRLTTPLFDARTFARYFETALLAINARQRSGLPPVTLRIPATPQ